MRFFEASFGFAILSLVSAETIAEINGNRFLSPFKDKNVTNVQGLVTARGPDGFWIRSVKPDNDVLTSDSIYVFGRYNGTNVTSGDIVSLNGRVAEFRSTATYLFLTEIIRPTDVTIISKNNTVKPIVLGNKNTSPPTLQFTSLDKGDVFGVPNNSSRVSVENPILEPTKYGLDFWESLVGELVTVKKPVAISKPNNFQNTWVHGDWKVTGKNKRGGLTLTAGDGNPEAIIIGNPLDGTRNPNSTKLGDSLEDITGIVTYAFGFYTILPLTALKITASKSPDLPKAVTWTSKGKCSKIVVGDYNVENMSPKSTNIPQVANHIVKFLNSPDILFLQEIQDNNGAINDAVVDASLTLDALTAAISAAGGPAYNYTQINPVDDSTGGEPGGNIRTAYLYNAAYLSLKDAKPGTATEATRVLAGPALSLNPGSIDPNNTAWSATRRPLVAQWEVLSSKSTFFTVNVHLSSKGGSSPIEGDARPPVNGGIAKRTLQTNVTASFISEILAVNPDANIIAAGDFNEFTFVQPMQVFQQVSGLVDADDAADLKPEERYTYLFDMSSQELDHVYVSRRIASKGVKVEHVHVNTWVGRAEEASDHDPSVLQVDVC